MGFYLSKLATQLAYPLPAALLLALVSLLLLLATRRRRTALLGLLLALGGLWLASTPALADAWVRALETRHPPRSIEATPEASAIVVLGGGLRLPSPPALWTDLRGGADRVLHAARLHRAGKAPVVIVSGGRMPWSQSPLTEAEAMAELLREWGVPPEDILLEDAGRTTYEGALRTRELLAGRGFASVLLVTSASHMPRALATFRTLGIAAEPVATDYPSYSADRAPGFDWVPNAEALVATQRVFKEVLGTRVYRWRGWIAD